MNADDDVKKAYFLLFALLALFLTLAVACQTPTPTPPISPPPTPTNESPIPTPTPPPLSPLPSPTPPVSPLQGPEAESADSVYWLTWEHGYTVCDSLGMSTTLKIAVKLVELDTDAVVFSETLDTGEFAPVISGTGQFDGMFEFDYPALKKDVEEWAKGWWSRIDGELLYCYDEWEQVYPMEAVDVRWFAGGTRDDEGYWPVREIAASKVFIYCPLSLHGDTAAPTPTPSPEAGTGGGDVPSVITALLISGIVVAAIVAFIWLFAREIVRGWIRDVLRRRRL